MTTRYTAAELLKLADLLLAVKSGIEADHRYDPANGLLQDAQHFVVQATDAIKRAAQQRAGEELIEEWEASQ